MNQAINTSFNEPGTVLIAIGNDGRQDDGLGWAFARAVEGLPFPGEIHYRYQLQIEDAALIATAPAVLFVDASKEILPKGFALTSCEPLSNIAFSTHAIAPEAVLAITEELYGARPPAYLLALEGVDWELQRGLSQAAKRHLERALAWFERQVIPGS